jgi:hypothetical protein
MYFGVADLRALASLACALRSIRPEQARLAFQELRRWAGESRDATAVKKGLERRNERRKGIP